jgi:hypothetical protein
VVRPASIFTTDEHVHYDGAGVFGDVHNFYTLVMENKESSAFNQKQNACST